MKKLEILTIDPYNSIIIGTRMSKPLALIIEDDPSSARLHKRLLSAAGYENRLR